LIGAVMTDASVAAGGVGEPSASERAITGSCGAGAVGEVAATASDTDAGLFVAPASAAVCRAAKDKVGVAAAVATAADPEGGGDWPVAGVEVGSGPVCPNRAASACANASSPLLAVAFEAALEPIVVAPPVAALWIPSLRKPLSRAVDLPPISAPTSVGADVGAVPGIAMGDTVDAMTL